MNRACQFLALTLLPAALLAGAGCASTSEDTCERLDTCNVLQGMSVSECVETWDQELDKLTSAAREDTVRLTEECLEFASCSGFRNCFGGGLFDTDNDGASFSGSSNDTSDVVNEPQPDQR